MSGLDRRSRGILALTWLAAFTGIVDLDIVTTALPRIGTAFGAGTSDLAWVVNAYVVVFAVAILGAGRLGDVYGRRRVLAGGALLFALATAGAALAPSLPALVALRALQGLAGSALMTTSLAVVTASFEGPLRARALGVMFSGAALGGVAGPVLGGLLVAAFGWRAMFSLQVPLALAVALLAVRLLPETERRSRSLDVPGLALGTIALLAVSAALLGGHDWGWLSIPSALAWGVALGAAGGFVARERAARDPAVRLAVFRNRRFVGASAIGAAAWFAILATSVQLPIRLQQGHGLDPAVTGLLMVAWPLGAFLAFPRVGALVARTGELPLMLGGTIVTAVALAVVAAMDRETPVWLLLPLGALMGPSTAAMIVPSAALAVAQFPPAEAGSASGVFNSIRQLGASLGAALPAAIYDVAAGGRFTGEPVFAGTQTALAVTALVLIGTTVLVVRILGRDAPESRQIPAAERA